MEVIVFTDRLSKALSSVIKITTSKNQMPILGNVLISTIDNGLSLTTTNLETSITTKVKAVVKQEGKTTVPAKQIYELVSLIKEEKVNIKVKDKKLIIDSVKNISSLTTSPAEEFPQTIIKNGEPTIIIKNNIFKHTLKQTSISVANDESRPILNGLRIKSDNEKIEFVSTDGYRLSLKYVKNEKKETIKPYIIPIKTLYEVVRVGGEEKAEEVKINILDKQNQAIFTFQDTEITTRLIEGEFPNFQKIIPDSFTTKAVIDKEEMLNSVKTSAVFARESAGIIRVKIEGKTITFSANAPSVGENSSTFNIDKEGDDVEVAFNYKFLVDFLSSVDEERIIFETNGSLNPGVFKLEKDKNYLHIIMPVRVQN